MFPTSQECDTLVQYKEVFQPLRHEWRYRKQFACIALEWTMSTSNEKEMLTHEVSPLFHDPSCGTVEAMVISGSEIYHREKE